MSCGDACKGECSGEVTGYCHCPLGVKVKIISGGQTGVDRAALEAAKEAGLETSGYAPNGFLTENGCDHTLKAFGLMDSGADYVTKTGLNVYHSDVTLWYGKEDTAGFLATKKKCKMFNKRFIVITGESAYGVRCAIGSYKIINIAGNRESVSPGIQAEAKALFAGAFQMLASE